MAEDEAILNSASWLHSMAKGALVQNHQLSTRLFPLSGPLEFVCWKSPKPWISIRLSNLIIVAFLMSTKSTIMHGVEVDNCKLPTKHFHTCVDPFRSQELHYKISILLLTPIVQNPNPEPLGPRERKG